MIPGERFAAVAVLVSVELIDRDQRVVAAIDGGTSGEQSMAEKAAAIVGKRGEQRIDADKIRTLTHGAGGAR